MKVNITKMGYSRVFSLGNYENEKISVECEIPEGMDTVDVYLELKKTVEDAHNLRRELRNYMNAKNIISNPDLYRGAEVKQALQDIESFEKKYPKLLDVKIHALLNDNGHSITDEDAY